MLGTVRGRLVALLLLVALAAPVVQGFSRYLPDFRGPHLDSITVRHLLQHSGGWDREKSFDPIGKLRQISKFVDKSIIEVKIILVEDWR